MTDEELDATVDVIAAVDAGVLPTRSIKESSKEIKHKKKARGNTGQRNGASRTWVTKTPVGTKIFGRVSECDEGQRERVSRRS